MPFISSAARNDKQLGKTSRQVKLSMAIAAVGALLAVGASAHANMIITPTYDSSITSDPNAATIKGTINGDIAYFDSIIANNINVAITFQEGGGLGSSSSYVYTVGYSSYYNQLQLQTKSANDTTALAHLPASGTTANPVNSSSSVTATGPLLRALGYNANSGDTYDTTITLNTSIMNLSRTGTQDPSKYDLQAVAEHEIDEALGGFGSALNGLSNGAAAPTGAIAPLDLFRYTSTPGVRSFNTTASTAAYFSIDGSTDIVRFNQQAGGDFSDYYSYPSGGSPPRVQDAFSTPGAQPNLNTELVALDVTGFTLAPEPGSIGLAAVAGVFGLLRRKRASA